MVDEATTRLLEGYNRTPEDKPQAPPKTPDRSDEWKAFEEKFDDALVRRERELAAEIDRADRPSEVRFRRSISSFMAYAGISRTSLYTDHANRVPDIGKMYEKLDDRIRKKEGSLKRVSVSSLQAELSSLKAKAKQDLEASASLQLSELVDLLGSNAGRNRHSLLQEIQTLADENRQLREMNARLRKMLQTLGADLSGSDKPGAE